MPANQRDILERRIEPAVALAGNLAHIGCSRSILAANRQTLRHSRKEQQRRRRRADCLISGENSDHQRSGAHQEHRQHHRILAAVRVGDPSEQPAAERPHEEPYGKNSGRRQQLAGLVARREKRCREVDRGKRVGIEIIPLDQISGRGGYDCLDTRKLLRRAIGDDFRFRCSHQSQLVTLPTDG